MSQDKVSARLLRTAVFITGILVFLALPFLPGRPKQNGVKPVRILLHSEEPHEPNEPNESNAPNERFLVAL